MSLREKAVLVHFTMTFFDGRRQDKDESTAVADRHGAKRGNTSLYLHTLPDAARSPFTTLKGRADRLHYKLTVPWARGGSALLPALHIDEYSAAMSEFRREFEAKRDEFLEEYPHYIRMAQQENGTLFNPEDYPSISRVAQRFHFGTSIYAVPTTSDIRINLSENEAQWVQEQTRAQQGEAEKIIVANLCSRLTDLIGKTRDALKDYGVDPVTGKLIGVFRDSTVTNLAELVNRLDALNLAGDETVRDIEERLYDDVTKYSAKQLRDDPNIRANAVNTLDDMLKSMNDFMA